MITACSSSFPATSTLNFLRMTVTQITSGQSYLIINALNHKAVDLPEDQEPSADHEIVVGYTAHGDRTQNVSLLDPVSTQTWVELILM